MTISELAKKAIEEKRDVRARRKSWAGYLIGCTTFYSSGVFTTSWLNCHSLFADDWYEVEW